MACYPEQHEELVHLVSRLPKIIIIIIIIFIVGGSFHFISFHFGIDISMNWRIAPALCVIEYHKAPSESLLNIGTLF